VLVRTKGDYNALPDDWTLKRAANAEADRVIEILPGPGRPPVTFRRSASPVWCC